MVTIKYDISKYHREDAPLSCKTFTVREVTSKDEDVASASAKAKGKDGQVMDELIRLSVTEVDGKDKSPESPFVEWDGFNIRTRTFIIRAFQKLNAMAKDEGDDFLSTGSVGVI
jgi:hypothetical protein